ncbi:MAG: ECF transporter S component [Clostridia bacterium]|nr:ECF transporter S component [Clostridia bacterium]
MKKLNLTAGRITLISLFTAIAFGLSFLEFPIFPATPFLELDFSFAILLIGGFMFGPVSAEIMIVALQLLKLVASQSFGVGELANFITANCFIFVPSLFYKFKKGIKVVIISLILAILLQTLAATLSNKFILFPLYGLNDEAFSSAFWFIVAFNVIKGVVNGAITLILYKRLKFLFTKFIDL